MIPVASDRIISIAAAAVRVRLTALAKLRAARANARHMRRVMRLTRLVSAVPAARGSRMGIPLHAAIRIMFITPGSANAIAASMKGRYFS